MPRASSSPPPAVAAFRALHASGCFVMPNPWDAGTAKALAELGFSALATTSAGLSFSHGLPDAVDALPRDTVLAHVRAIVQATPLPVNVDFQSGYAAEVEGLATNVALCVRTGAAGLSIEDATGEERSPLYPLDLALERVRAARGAIDATGVPAVLTARCEAWLVGDPDPLRTARERLPAFAAAGADCLYAPGVRAPADIAALVHAVAPKPLNVLVPGPLPGLSLQELADLGVRRLSLGSTLARVALGAFLRAARGLRQGSLDGLAGAEPFAALNQLFRRG
jgi:2-methylisocitrate lyase-like PEP mutase family enzyme